ncbi:HlyD family type I secretion periplasmic adaptor subunit [Kiloniella sp. b19]|uniref:HlyD family type I secretion periplasmic adaptor subunit n=1 Tax=Kiloniella sp. GXU_MW_B19 TaxID=3141326 RepID=UPI0031D50025
MSNRAKKDEDIFFMPDVHAATFRKGRRMAYILTFTSFCFFVTFGVWAHYAIVDEVTRGEGTIVPSRKTQVIQNLEGGIVSEILVREGDIVEEGDIVIRIDNTQARASFRDAKSQRNVLEATVARLMAEFSGLDELVFDEAFIEQAPQEVSDQLSLFNARKQQLDAQIRVLRNQEQQRTQEVAEARSRISQLRRSLQLARDEMAITEPLVKKGISPRVDLIRVQRQVADLEGEISTLRTSIPRLESAVREAQQRIDEVRLTSQAEVSDELNRTRAELKSVIESIAAGEDTVKRTDVRSPVHGTIKELKHNTVGGVIRPGEDIVEIVPLDDTLLIEAKIRPADRAFLRSGQKAIVKVTAYDFSIYGGLEAELERISASTIKEQKGGQEESFYRVYLRSEDNKIINRGKELDIIPGMTANVEILTGKKSVLDYLLKPILKARDGALRER